MLTITVLGEEHFNEVTQEIFTVGDVILELEHSLVSLSKWEEIHEKPFLDRNEKTTEEVMSYVWCMILTQDVTPDIFRRLSQENINEIQQYIDAKRTATWFNERPESRVNGGGKTITSELIYYWLTTAQIDWEVQHWHLNRLFTLLKIFNAENGKPVKRGRAEMAAERRELNAARRARTGSSG